MSTADLTTDYIEKRAKFKKRAEANLNKKVLEGLKQLGRCANRKIYAYDEQQVEKLFTQIEAAVIEARKSFATDSGETKKTWVEL
jgi:ribosome biogenesis protein Nip4